MWETKIFGYCLKHARTTSLTDDTHVDGVCRNLEELESTHTILFFLHGHRGATHYNLFIAAERFTAVSQHDHIIQILNQRFQDILIDPGRHVLQHLGGVAHQHAEAGRGRCRTAHLVGSSDVPGDGAHFVGYVSHGFVNAQQFVGITLGLEERYWIACVDAHRVRHGSPPLPRIQVIIRGR